MHHAFKAGGALHRDERTKRHHLALGIARLQLHDVFRLMAVAGVGRHIHLVDATEAVEVVDVQRAEISLHGVVDVSQIHTFRLRLFAIHVGINLRHAHLVAGEQTSQCRHLLALRDQVLRLLVKLVEAKLAAIFDLDAEAADRTQALHGRRWERSNVGILDRCELLIQRGSNRTG
jgi:hypothetical protein